jgi:hypothetical protein
VQEKHLLPHLPPLPLPHQLPLPHPLLLLPLQELLPELHKAIN